MTERHTSAYTTHIEHSLLYDFKATQMSLTGVLQNVIWVKLVLSPKKMAVGNEFKLWLNFWFQGPAEETDT
jgi:hypothetical protein